MAKISVTYIAPPGDNKVVETRGVTFFDGQAKEIEFDDHEDLIRKSAINPHFKVDGDIPEDKPRRGRKPAVKEV